MPANVSPSMAGFPLFMLYQLVKMCQYLSYRLIKYSQVVLSLMRSIMLIFGLSTCLFASSALACKLTFAVSNEFPPHHMLDDAGRWRGVAIDLFQWLVSGAGCTVEVVNVPWDRTIVMLEHGKIDAVSLFTKSDERQKFTHFVGPHHQESIVVIVDHKRASALKQPIDLIQFPGLIGKTSGTYYGQELEAILSNQQLKGKLVDIVENENRINMLLRGRLDAVLEEATVAEHLYQTNRLDEAKQVVRLRFNLNPVYFGFSRKSVDQETLRSIQQSWSNMQSNDAIQSVYQQYGLDHRPVVEVLKNKQ